MLQAKVDLLANTQMVSAVSRSLLVPSKPEVSPPVIATG